MSRIKAIVYISFLLFAQNIFAQQVDTVSFQIFRDAGNTYKVNCLAYKVNYSATDTTYEEFELSDTVNGSYTFSWGGDELPQGVNNIHRATYQYTAPGAYEITLSVIEDASGTTYNVADTAIIRDVIVVPNVFTPNGDGINDLFIVRSNGIDPLEMSIYSKTGTLVYKQKAPIIVWDGRNASGSKVSQGVYYYILEPSRPDQEAQNGLIYLYPQKQ